MVANINKKELYLLLCRVPVRVLVEMRIRENKMEG